MRLIQKAGLQPWPRLFHSMRNSRETELAKDHPLHIVTAWMGNTPKIAMKHYLMVTDSDFDRATGKPTCNRSRVGNLQNKGIENHVLICHVAI